MNDDPIKYDDDEAVKFIQNELPQELKGKFSTDEINYIIDIVYDFYDQKGLMDENIKDDDLVEISEDEMVAFVLKSAKKDKLFKFTEDEIKFIVQGEIDYCDSLGLYED